MEKARLFRTSAVRLALRYGVVTLLVGTLVLGALYWAISQYVDAQLRAGLQAEFYRLVELDTVDGVDAVKTELEAPSGLSGNPGSYTLLTDAMGKRLAGNLRAWPPEDPPPLDGKVHAIWLEDDIIPGQLYDDDAFWPVIARKLSGGQRLLIARSVDSAEASQMLILYGLGGILGTIVIMALAIGLTMGHDMLSRVDTITRTATNIIDGRLSSRIPVGKKHDEFDALSERLNWMLDCIQQLVGRIRTKTDNIAHDMRAPLTTLRNRLDVALLQDRSGTEYREAIEHAVEDLSSIDRTFNALLEIAKVESGSLQSKTQNVDICAICHEVMEMFLPVAESRQQTLTAELPEHAMLNGIPHLITQAIGNLVDNAVKFTPDGGNIELRVRIADGKNIVSVSDNGPGIPAEEIEHVQQRFIRLDTARNSPGNGLGLAMVKAAAAAHGAELIFADAKPGLRAELRFKV